MEPIKAQTSVPLDEIVKSAIDELETGIYEATERGNYDEAETHYLRGDAMFGFFTMEYNAIDHNWPIDIDPNTAKLIREALKLHHDLLELISNRPPEDW